MADPLDKVLKRVQQGARDNTKSPHDPGHTRKSFSATAANGQEVHVELYDEAAWAFDDASSLLSRDQRFEYMDEKERDAALMRFAATAGAERGGNRVPAFIAEHEHEIIQLTCTFTVEELVMDRRREMFGATFIPANEVDLPGWPFAPIPKADSLIAVQCAGSGGQPMMERAKASAEHALRLLRVGLRKHRSLVDDQIRFRLGIHYWFTVDGQARPGWKRRPGEAIPFGPINDEFVDLAHSTPTATLTEHGVNDVEQRANRALIWWERSFFSTDSVVKIVFLFAALEAMLGDNDPGLKADNLAMRRAALSEALGLGFTLPDRALVLYEHVRSKAVHGEEPYTVTSEQATAFEWDIREAIVEYLNFARLEHLTKRAHVRASLEAKRREIEDWIEREFGTG